MQGIGQWVEPKFSYSRKGGSTREGRGFKQVDSDGVSLISGPERMVTNDAIDGSSVEAPTMLYGAGQGVYFLIYNRGCYTASTYTVQVATATSLAGLWTKYTSPFLVTGQTDA